MLLSVVVSTALVGGWWPAVLAALISGRTLNLVFIAPTGTLAIAEPQSALALIAFLLIAMAVASVVDRSARRTQEAVRARAEADALADLARRLLHAESDPAELLATADAALGMSGSAIWRTHPDGRVEVEATSGRSPSPGEPLARSTTVSHDLRSPIAAIKAATSSLRSLDVVWSAADEAELLATVEDGADRLEHLVANLLDLSRLQTGAVTPLVAELDVSEVVETALAPLPGAQAVEIDVDSDLPPLRADPGLVDRVVANLVANALT